MRPTLSCLAIADWLKPFLASFFIACFCGATVAGRPWARPVIRRPTRCERRKLRPEKLLKRRGPAFFFAPQPFAPPIKNVALCGAFAPEQTIFQYVGGNRFKGIDPLGLWQFTAIAGDELALWGAIGYNSGQTVRECFQIRSPRSNNNPVAKKHTARVERMWLNSRLYPRPTPPDDRNHTAVTR